MTNLSRRRLLAVGAGASLAVAVGPVASAFAAPAPVEDDLAYLQLLAVGKLIAIAHLEAVLADPPSAQARRQLGAILADDRAHKAALDAVLAEDAPTTDDWQIAIPKAATGDLRKAAAFAARLDTVLRGVVLDGSGVVEDPRTRILLAQIGASDSQHIAALRLLGRRSPAGPALARRVPVEEAGAYLDRFLVADDPADSLAARLRRIAR